MRNHLLRLFFAKSKSAFRNLQFLLLLCSLLLAPCFHSQAQQPARIPRIGILVAYSPSLLSARLAALRQRLRALGYVEGNNIALELRSAEGEPDRLPTRSRKSTRERLSDPFML